MSDSLPELPRRMRRRVRTEGARPRTPASVLPLRPSDLCEQLPWEPGRFELTRDELQLIASLRREVNEELASEEAVSDCDILHLALQHLQQRLRSAAREDLLLRLNFYLCTERQK
jgi:hypothetical protein